MTDNFKEIGSLFGREGAGAGFVKQTDKESFTYAFAWPEGDTWATLTGYLNLDEQPEEYVRRVLQDGGFRSDWGNPDYDPIGDFKETAGDEYRIPLLKVLLREQLESRYEVANHFSTMNRARVELSAFIQSEGGAPLPEDALGTPEEQGIRAIFATEEMAKAGYLSQLDYSKVVEMGDFYTVLNGDIVAVGFDPEPGRAGRSRMGRLPAWKGTSPLSVDPEAERRLSMISGTVSLRAATTFPWRATTAPPAGTRSRRMRLQGMRPERMTRTSDRTRSDKK